MASSSSDMDLYAEPIPPTLVGKTLPRTNFREVVLRRLTAVQEQKKSLNTTPIRLAPELWKSEKDILVEMLEKTQKLQLASQQAWSQEREDLERQLKRLEASSRSQAEALRQDNDRLRSELDRLKVFEHDPETEAALLDLHQRYKDREEQLTQQVRNLESTLAQYKEGLDKATEELEKKRFLADERSVMVEAKAEETVTQLRKEVSQLQAALKEGESKKKKVTRLVGVQTDGKQDDLTRFQSLYEDSKKENAALRVQFDRELVTVKDEASRQISALRAQLSVLQTQASCSSEQDLIPHIYEGLQQLIRLKTPQEPLLPTSLDLSVLEEWTQLSQIHVKIRTLLTDLLGKCENVHIPTEKWSSEGENRAKICIEMYTFSLKAVLEVARNMHSGTESALLQVDNDRLRKERDMLLAAIQTLTEQQRTQKAFETAVEGLKTVANRLESEGKAMERVEEICKQLQFRCLSTLTALEVSAEEDRQRVSLNSSAETALISQLQSIAERLKDESEDKQTSLLQQQKARLEEALARLKQLYDSELEQLTNQFAAYQDLVSTERTRLSENLEKVAESVEYRQDVWEQFQAPGEDENLQQVQTLAEELERQTQWELGTLATMLTRLRTPLQREEPVDINEIKEEDEEEEEDVPDSVVVKLR